MKKSCEGVYSGCNFGKTVRPNSEKEFVDYVIGKIQEGKPVVIRVVSKKCAKTKKQCGRHFVTVIGFKQNSTGSWKDFLIVDSWDALIERMDTNNRAVVPYKKTIPVDRDPSKPNQYMATPVK